MKKKFPLFILFLLLFLLGSCVSSHKQITSIEMDTLFTPQKVYLVDFDSAWEIVFKALQDNKIPLGSLTKETGIMRTDYLPGPDLKIMKNDFYSRYKYHIIFFKEPENKTIMNIRCIYELKERNRGQYVDATSFSTKEVVVLEKELYKILESHLRPVEASRKPAKEIPQEPGKKEKPTILAQPQTSPPPPAPAPAQMAKPEAKELSPGPLPAPAKELPPSRKELQPEMTPRPQSPPPPALQNVPEPPAPKVIEVPQPPSLPVAKTSPPPPAHVKEGPSPTAPAKGVSPPPVPAKEIPPSPTPAKPEIRPEPFKRAPEMPAFNWVIAKNATMRAEDSSNSKVVTIVKKGRKVKKIGESGNWAHIQLSWGATGWVLKILVREAND